jgi:hypothetical protein
MMRFWWGVLSVVLAAATSAGVAAAQSDGLPAEWETRKNLSDLTLGAQGLKPFLDSLKPEEWAENGAPSAYAAQLKSAQDQLRYLADVAGKLSQQPDKLSLALETYFRYQALESMIGSVSAAVRKYQNSAIAELLENQLAQCAPSRDKLRQYVLALVVAKEQEFAVADREAQRCRQTMSRQPAQPPAPAAKQDRK